MDPYSSTESFNIKTRKPYTITKQRERWTEDEHNSFLEALKLYGRAWQRIEEHIGTKTAVQIRSHAQKFFTKLEKEAVARGVPIKQALDMEIPPPRPKRKPNYPYPRKTGHPQKEAATLVSSLQSGIQTLDLETKPLPETTSHEEKLENAKQVEDAIQGPCSENENCAGVFREFIPATEEVITTHDESYITIETQKSDHTNITCALFEHQNIINDCQYSSDKPGNVSINDTRGVHNYPRHVPVQVVDAKNSEMSFQESTLNKSGEVENIAVAASSGHHNSYPTTFHPLSSDNHRSFLHASSTISSLIVSSLLQNPAAHAAASFAATFWHPAATTEASSAADSPPSVETPPPPSMAAIAAATVAAATAWWAAHGLLPVCTPFYPCTSSPFSFNQPNNGGNGGGDKAPSQEKKMNAEKSEKPPGSGNHSDKKSNAEAVVGDDTKEMAPVTEPSKANVRKQVDRSSCGSNTTSSSEIETDALPNHGNGNGKEKEKEEPKASDVIDSISRRSRSSTISPNESWKEVSEEGRLAFQALFSRQVLPQSFCSVGEDENVSHLDLNREAGESNGKGVDEGLLTMGLGNVKLNIHHTGFKPYKRCSIQDKIVSHQQNDEKGPKRMRLEPDQID